MNEIVTTFRQIAPDYAPTDLGIFAAEPDKVRRVKEIVAALPQVERTLILLYADCGSYAKLAARLGISKTSIKRIINGIKDTILADYYELTAKELNERIK